MLSHDAVAVPLVTRGASSGAITDYAPTSSLSKYSLFATTMNDNDLVVSHIIIYTRGFCLYATVQTLVAARSPLLNGTD